MINSIFIALKIAVYIDVLTKKNGLFQRVYRRFQRMDFATLKRLSKAVFKTIQLSLKRPLDGLRKAWKIHDT